MNALLWMKTAAPELSASARRPLWLAALALALVLGGCKPASEASAGPGASGSPGLAASGQPGGQGQAGGPGNSGWAGGQAGQGRGRNAAISVQIITAQAGALKADHQTAGIIQPVTTSNVSAQTTGVVSRLLRHVGDWVSEGETVIKLDDAALTLTARNSQAVLDNARLNLAATRETISQAGPRLQMQVESARRAFESAQKSYAAAKALFDLGGLAGSDLDNAAGAVANAQANLESAKTNLDLNGKTGTGNLDQLQIAVDQAGIQLQQAQLNLAFTNVKAPFTGQIAAINVAPGQFITTATAAFTLVSSQRQIAFNATPVEAARLSLGAPVYFISNGQALPAHVSQAPSAPINGMVPMVARVAATENLPFGTVGTISFSMNLAQGIIIPVTALQANEKQYFVYTVQNGKAVQQAIGIIDQAGSDVAVSGIQPNAQVILNAPPGLLPGSTVQAMGSAAQAAGARPAAAAAGAAGGTGGTRQAGQWQSRQGGAADQGFQANGNGAAQAGAAAAPAGNGAAQPDAGAPAGQQRRHRSAAAPAASPAAEGAGATQAARP